MTEKKTGLIMEGGAMRGMFTCGVIDVWMEHGITFDGAIGVSAGASFGCNYKSKQIGRAIRYNKRFCGDYRFGSWKSFFRSGDMYDAEFCYHRIPEELDPFDTKTYRENPMKFYVVCTDVTTGKAVYHLCPTGKREDVEWMRASSSMPVVSRVVELDGRKLLDGGIADSIPVRYFQHIGYNRNVAILTQPLDYRKKPMKLMPLVRIMLRNYPRMVAAIANRHIRYNRTLDYIKQQEMSGNLFVIRPPRPLNIKSTETDPKQLERVYQLGRSEGERCLGDLTKYLSE